MKIYEAVLVGKQNSILEKMLVTARDKKIAMNPSINRHEITAKL